MESTYSMTHKFKGFRKNSIECYLGIPYAQAPIGNLRFKAPRKLSSSPKQLVDCTTFSANPVQKGKLETSEDCLYLNIWKPQQTNDPLPVMVWIYGGSFETGGIGENGAGFGMTFDGAKLAEETGCVIVTVNYRLNVFGFLDFSDLSPHFDRNIGLKDILCALEWIQENISEWHGDPANVTLFGQSAGGALVSALSAIPKAQDYYHKVIIQSACLESFYSLSEAKVVRDAFLSLLKKKPSQIDDLLQLPAEKFIEILSDLEMIVREKILGITTFCPIIDGDFLLDFPFFQSDVASKPMIIGSTKNEGRLFTRFSKAISQEEGARFFPYFSESDRSDILKHYPNFPNFTQNSQLITDIMYTIPKYWLADSYSQKNRVYMYRFDIYSGIFSLLSLNACHAIDVPILFGLHSYLFIGKRLATQKIGKEMRAYWGNFAKTGNPNSDHLPVWQVYDPKAPQAMLFDTTSESQVNPDELPRKIYAQHMLFFHPNQKPSAS